MSEDKTRLGLTIGIGLWVLAALVKGVYTGLIGITNPFGWLLSLIETIEFAAWLLGPGSLDLFLSALGTSEAGLILAGLFGVSAWITTTVYGIRYSRETDQSIAYVFGVVWFYPVVAVAAAWWLLRGEDASSEQESVTAEPEQA